MSKSKSTGASSWKTVLSPKTIVMAKKTKKKPAVQSQLLKSGAVATTTTTKIATAQAPEPEPQTKGSRAKSLAELNQALMGCELCKLCKTRTKIVFGDGNARAKLMFVGEAPGESEDLQGRPFVGRAGQLLEKMIEAMGLSRSEVYIANVVKCRPPENRNPEPDEIESCEPFLHQQIDLIRPEVIVALGKFAAQTLLRTETPISNLRGQFHEYRGITLMPTFHPAYLLRNPPSKKEAWEDLKQVAGRLGIKVPAAKK